MAEYRRIVSYLYKYINGQKGENVGFVRVETRSDGLRLFFHVKDLRMMDERPIKAYFYFHEGTQKKAVFVDEFLCSRGNCEYKETKKEQEILGDRELTALNGMVFYDRNGLLYGTCWDEKEIVEGNILLPEDNKPEQEIELELERKAEQEIKPEPERKAEQEIEPEQQMQLEVAKETVLTIEEVESLVKEVESDENNTVEQSSNMEKLLREKPSVPIQWDLSLLEAVKIQPKDIAKFPIKDWRLADNGFLLQGYENYQYLILGRIQMKPEKDFWVLGVPGIYDNREKYLAGIFGFHDYIPMEQGKLKTGGNGFWITGLSNSK